MAQQNNDPINALPEYEVRTMKDDLDRSEGRATEKKLVSLKIPETKSEPPKNLPIITGVKQSPKPIIKPLPKQLSSAEIDDILNAPKIESRPKTEPKKSSLPNIEDFIVSPKIMPATIPILPTPTVKPVTAKTESPIAKKTSAQNDNEVEQVIRSHNAKKLMTVLGAIVVFGLVAGLGYWLIIKQKPIKPTPPINNGPEISASLISIDETKNLRISNNVSFIDILINEESLEQPDKTIKRIVPIKNSQTNENGEVLSLNELIQGLQIHVPPYTLAELKDNYTLIVYKQGQQQRIGLIIEINNLNDFLDQSRLWEKTMPEDLKNIFLNHQPSNLIAKEFFDNRYKELNIRFVNFPGPDLTIDYAIINNLFLLSTSKESMYNIIDRIK